MASMPCSGEWEVAWSVAQAHLVQEGRGTVYYPEKP
jgi:hypothetical protein